MKKGYFLLCIILSACESPTTDVKYEVVMMDNRDPIINMDVFLPDTLQLEKLNTFLKSKYNSGRDKYFEVWYFDDRNAANVYRTKLMSQNPPEEELKKLTPHRIAVYTFNPSNHYEEFSR